MKIERKDIERMRKLFDKRSIEDPSAFITLRVMFGKDIPRTHCKNIILVLDRILKNWGEEE